MDSPEHESGYRISSRPALFCYVVVSPSVALSSWDPENKDQEHSRGHESKRMGKYRGVIRTDAKWSSTSYQSNAALRAE